MRRTTLLVAGAVALLAAGCTAGGADERPTFAPSYVGPNVEGSPGAHLQPILPTPSLAPPSTTAPSPGSGSSSASTTPERDPLVVATKLTTPVALAMMPDNTALVGERTTGRIVRVQAVAGKPVPTVRTLPGVDGSGDGGLLDLALSPNYDEDNLIYAYETTATDNRVVAFTLTGPVTTVLTGIPKGRTGNTGRLLFTTDGSLYVGTGDAGQPALAANPASLAGKVLRITDIGRPAPGNPSATSPIYTSGHRRVDGLCVGTRPGSVFEVETAATAGRDEVNLLVGGEYYGWPTARSAQRNTLAPIPATTGSPGGCATLQGRIWITSLDGKELLGASIGGTSTAPAIGKFTAALANRYGRLRTVVAAADGALWITTSNRDGKGKPVPADERVIRWMPDSNNGGGASTA